MSLEQIALKSIIKSKENKIINSIPCTTLFNILNKIDNGQIKLKGIELGLLLHRIIQMENCKSFKKLERLINKLYMTLSLSPSTSLYIPNDPKLLISRIKILYINETTFSKVEVNDIINYLSEVFDEYVSNVYLSILNKSNCNEFKLDQHFYGNATIGFQIPFALYNNYFDREIEERNGEIIFFDTTCDERLFDILSQLNDNELKNLNFLSSKKIIKL